MLFVYTLIFRTAIERQVAEAISIAREKNRGKKLLNSKSEYNRCKLPRIITKNLRKEKEEIDEENEEDRIVRELLRNMVKERKNKRGRKIQNRNVELKSAIIEIGNENVTNFKKRRIEQIEKKKQREKEEEESMKRNERINLANYKKKEMLRKIIQRKVMTGLKRNRETGDSIEKEKKTI